MSSPLFCRSPDEAHIRALFCRASPAADWRCAALIGHDDTARAVAR
jgi:hypothetical protein